MKLRILRSSLLVALSVVSASAIVPGARAQAQQLTPVVNTSLPKLHFSSRFDDTPSLIQEASPAEESAEESVDSAGTKQDSLAPIQTRELTTEVRAVSTSLADLGTGVLPDATPAGMMSEQRMLPDGLARGATHMHFHWRPSLVFHHPLYFEQAMLERHGHSRFGYLQPIASGVRFYSTIALYPYLRTLRPPCECHYALGQYRAGTCAPLLKDHVPWDKRAAAVETLSAGGFFWAAPL